MALLGCAMIASNKGYIVNNVKLNWA